MEGQNQKITVVLNRNWYISTLSKKLKAKLGLPIIHLDKVYWKPNWTETPKDEFESKVAQLMQQDVFIMDGNYASTLAMRVKSADTIIYLDYPTYLCFWRVTKRIIKHHGTTRSDMTPGCHERFDMEFLHYVLAFRWIATPKIEKILKTGDYNAEVIRLESDKAVGSYLESL